MLTCFGRLFLRKRGVFLVGDAVAQADSFQEIKCSMGSYLYKAMVINRDHPIRQPNFYQFFQVSKTGFPRFSTTLLIDTSSLYFPQMTRRSFIAF